MPGDFVLKRSVTCWMHLEGSRGLRIRDIQRLQDWEDPQRPAESVRCSVLNDFIKTGLHTRRLPSYIFRFVLRSDDRQYNRKSEGERDKRASVESHTWCYAPPAHKHRLWAVQFSRLWPWGYFSFWIPEHIDKTATDKGMFIFT